MKFWGEPAVELNSRRLLSHNRNQSSEALLVFFSHIHPITASPPVFFQTSEVLVCVCVGVARGGVGEVGGGVRAALKRKCVIVTELSRKSRGGQCADRTLGCMIRGRGLNMNPLEPSSSPSLSLTAASEGPGAGFTLAKWHRCDGEITSRHPWCGRRHPSGVNCRPNLRTTSKQTNITSGFSPSSTAPTVDTTSPSLLNSPWWYFFFQTRTPNWTEKHFGCSHNERQPASSHLQSPCGFEG